MAFMVALVLLIDISVLSAGIPPNFTVYRSCSQSCMWDYYPGSGCTNEGILSLLNDCLCSNVNLEKSIAICVGGSCGLTEANETAALWNSNCLEAGADNALSSNEFLSLAEQASTGSVSILHVTVHLRKSAFAEIL